MIADRYEFRVPGPLRGFSKDFTVCYSSQYRAFKSEVRYLANSAGVPDEILDTDTVDVYVRIFWKKKARIDNSNVLKIVEDGLFKQDRGISGTHATRTEYHGEEYADVCVTVERR